jgi:broad specificity phosphatase PhoE
MSGEASRPLLTRVHLVRHGEVENPGRTLYGRLPGFHLSEHGRQQAAAVARVLSARPVVAVWSGPLERALETAELIAEPHGLVVKVDERLSEGGTLLEGRRRAPLSLLGSPRSAWLFRNPFRPSWGEPFREIRARMTAAFWDLVGECLGADGVIVSHQGPIWVLKNALAGWARTPWLRPVRVDLASVWTVHLEGNPPRVVGFSYSVPWKQPPGG